MRKGNRFSILIDSFPTNTFDSKTDIVQFALLSFSILTHQSLGIVWPTLLCSKMEKVCKNLITKLKVLNICVYRLYFKEFLDYDISQLFLFSYKRIPFYKIE